MKNYKGLKQYIPTLVLAIVLITLDIAFFRGTPWIAPLIVLSVAIAIAPWWIGFFLTLQRQKEIESRFPDFVRNLSGSIKSGMPAPRAIIHVSRIDYGALSPYVKKLANQIEWAIPVHKALFNFANDTRNPVIKRAVSSVIEAEMSGGNIEDVLESVTESVVEIKKLKQSRRAATHAQIVQSYVIFAVFLVVMIIIQNLLVPYIQSLEATGGGATAVAGIGLKGGLGGLTMKVAIDTSSLPAFLDTLYAWFSSLHGIFLMVAVIQALFAGLVIGKLSEGSVIFGVKHSVILIIFAFLFVLLAQGFVK
jgi:flagellar protein FlaJ